MADMPADTVLVRVRDLGLLANVGINPDEIGRRQPIVITLEIAINSTMIDTIAETVDYRRIVTAAEALAAKHIPLIETFAHRLACECAGWPQVRSARVAIDKPFALMRGLAGTEVLVHGANGVDGG